MRVRWLLDVDGVLSPFGHPNQDDYVGLYITGFSMPYSPSVMDRIRAVLNTPTVEHHWLTTWGWRANGDIAPAYDLPQGHLTREPPSHVGSEHPSVDREDYRWWKAEAARAHLTCGAPVIWTDDDLTKPSRRRAKEIATGPLLLLTPMSGLGLTHAHLDSIEAFVAEHGS